MRGNAGGPHSPLVCGGGLGVTHASMKTLATFVVASASALLLQSSLFAGAADDYQVTGPVTALTDTVITIQKKDQLWQINRTPATKVDGELKVGAKVTVHYTMTATSVDAKAEKAKK